MQKMVELGDSMASPAEGAKGNIQPNTAELDIDDIRSKIRLHAIQTYTSDAAAKTHEQTRVLGAEASTQRRRETTTRFPEHIGKQLGMLLKRPDPFEQLIAEQRVNTSPATRNNAGSFFSLAALTKSERWDRDRSVRTADAQVPNDQ